MGMLLDWLNVSRHCGRPAMVSDIRFLTSFSVRPLRKKGPAADSGPAATIDPVPPLFALVIGIDKYLHSSRGTLKALHGAVADADDVYTFLHKTLRVPENQIENLRNENATRAHIEKKIEDLGRNPDIKQGDPILIYYAGYGAEANAPPRWDSANGKIQMLVPYDFVPGGSNDHRRGQGVLDVKFNHLLAELAKKSDNITVILDCCHSASGTRDDSSDLTSAVRGIELPNRYAIPNDLFPPDIAPNTRADSVAEGFQTAGLSSHVLLAACKAGEVARENSEGGSKRGEFTLGLLKLLREKGIKLTYEEIIHNLQNLTSQHPQCEGVHKSRYLFDSKVASPTREIYRIRAPVDDDYDRHGVMSSSEQFVLEAGVTHGITEDAEFVVFADQTKALEFAREGALGVGVGVVGTVVALEATAVITTCEFTPREDVTTERFTSGFAVQTRAGEGHDIRLYVELDKRFLVVFKQIVAQMQAGKGRIHLVDSRDDKPDLVVAVDGGVVHFEIMHDICRQHGLTRMPSTVDINDSDTIQHILRSFRDFHWHLHRSCLQGPLDGKITLECTKLKETGLFKGLRAVLAPDGGNLHKESKILIDVDEKVNYGFKITNADPEIDVPLYVSIFYFDYSDLSIKLYYEPGIAKDGNVDASLPRRDSSLTTNPSLTIGYGASGMDPRSYRLREGQNVDVGFLKLFVSTDYVNLSGIAQKSPFEKSREDIGGDHGRNRRDCYTLRGQEWRRVVPELPT
ncbi:caspase domain-containing protein [Armillaria mellea]|nr:caspase domain-containing protein [Armillaria mellea]